MPTTPPQAEGEKQWHVVEDEVPAIDYENFDIPPAAEKEGGATV